MPFRHVRLAVIGLAVLAAGTARGQVDPDLPGRPDSDYRAENQLRSMKDGKVRVLGPDADRNKAAFQAVAERFVFTVNDPKFYSFDEDDGKLRPRPSNQTIDWVINSMRRDFILVPAVDSRLSVDQGEYVAGFGAALDAAIRTMLKSSNPLVRVNAARMLVVAAEAGAPAQGKMITELMTAPNTPPEVLLYAYKAAGNLLSAYHPLAVRNNDPNRHSLPDEELVPLVAALENHVLTNPPVAQYVAVETVGPPPAAAADRAADPADPAAATDPPAAAGDGKLDATGLTGDQVSIIRFYRRDAVRALAKVRYDILGGTRDAAEIRPVFTLARVAAGDPAIVPAPDPIETAEAVLGLLTVRPGNKLNVDELAQAVAVGLARFARAKVAAGEAGPAAQVVSWKAYAVRLGRAFDAWLASPRQNPRALAYEPTIKSLSAVAMNEIVSKLDPGGAGGVGTGLNVSRLTDWIARNPPKDAGRSLFNDSPKYIPAGGRPGA